MEDDVGEEKEEEEKKEEEERTAAIRIKRAKDLLYMYRKCMCLYVCIYIYTKTYIHV